MQPHDTTTPPMKTCTKCGETKPATTEYFHRTKKSPDGLRTICKPCRAKYAAENKEHIAEYKRNYHAENKEKIAQQKRAYRKANPERITELNKQKWARTDKKRERERSRAYRSANKERLAEQKRAYYQENKERLDKKNKAWKKANPQRWQVFYSSWCQDNREQINEKNRQWRENNSDRYKRYKKRYNRTYQEENRDKVNAKTRNYRARKRAAKGTHTAEDIQRQYDAQHGRCYYCGYKVGKKYHVDHVIPLSRGGSNSPDNIVIACPQCNWSKNDKLPHEWPEGGRLL